MRKIVLSKKSCYSPVEENKNLGDIFSKIKNYILKKDKIGKMKQSLKAK
jgi:hypothetical protein